MNDKRHFYLNGLKKPGVLIREKFVLSIESDDEVFFKDQLDLYLRRHLDTLSS